MKINLYIFFLFFVSNCSAGIYYVSSVSGNDSRSSIEAQNALTPWRSLNKINSFSVNFIPGDVVLLKRGESFYGDINISSSGTSNNPIIFGAYGTGSKPLITGFLKISNWTQFGIGIYEFKCSSCTNNLNMVTFQDSVQPLGRWPNISAPGAGYLSFQSHIGTTSITSNSINNAPNFIGGELVIRPFGWLINRAKVLGQTFNKIDYLIPPDDISSLAYEPQDGYGFFFQNHINALTRLGDWMYDGTLKNFRMYFGTKDPKNYSVNVSSIENLVNLSNNKNLIFDGLSFEGANSNAFKIDSASNIIIKDCDIRFSGIDGLYVTNNSKYITFKNSSIVNSCNNAITANGSTGWTLQNNHIKNTGVIRGMGQSGDGQYIAISHIGDKSLIEFNEIKNSGYNGIEFQGDSIVIRNNFIDSFCLIKSDGGGIYNSAEKDKKGRKIISNIILNGIGDRFGRSREEIESVYEGNVHGIYMDGGAADILIANNTVAHCSNSGLEISSPLNVQVINNTFYNNTVTQIFYFQSKYPISNLSIKQNILFSRKPDQLISLIASSFDDENKWGTIDSNYYCRPVSEDKNIDTSGYSHSPSLYDYPDGGIIQAANGRFYSLDKWQIISGQDFHTKKTPVDSIDLNNIIFIYNASNIATTNPLDGLYFDVRNNLFNNLITLAPYSSAILLKKYPQKVLGYKINVYPNPFRTAATIQIYPDETKEATLKVFDMHGRLIKLLFNGLLESGVLKSFILNNEGMGSSTYIIQLATKNNVINEKIILIRR